jgi:hypothetical protein
MQNEENLKVVYIDGKPAIPKDGGLEILVEGATLSRVNGSEARRLAIDTASASGFGRPAIRKESSPYGVNPDGSDFAPVVADPKTGVERPVPAPQGLKFRRAFLVIAS